MLYSPFTALLEKTRLLFQRRVKDGQLAVLGDSDGTGARTEVPDAPGYVYARFPGTPDASGNATYSAPFLVRSGNAAFQNYPGASVYVAYGYNNELEIVSGNYQEMDRSGIDTRTLNPLHQQSKWVYLWQLTIGLCSAVTTSVTDSLLVTVKKYRHYVNNTFQTFETGLQSVKIDLASYVPAADMHRYAAVWIDTYTNTAEVTTSTTQSMFTPLDATDIQELVTSRPPDAIPHKAFYLSNAQTSVSQNAAADVDLRQFLNTPPVHGLPYTVAYRERIQPDRQGVFVGSMIVTGSLIVLGSLVSVPINTSDATGSGSGGMTSFDVAADTGTPATITDGDEVGIVGDGETIDTSIAAKVVTIAVKPKALPKVCDIRMTYDFGSSGAIEETYADTFTDVQYLEFFPVYSGGTFSLPVSGVWTYFDIGDITGHIDFAKTGLTGDVTNGSAVITDIANTAQLALGMKVSGTGINAAATISSIDSTSQITMSHTASATNADVALTFTFPASTNYDVFLKYDSIAAAVLPVYEKFSSGNTRVGTYLGAYDYVIVSNTNDDKRFLGTIRATAGGFQKNLTQCFVSNWNHPAYHYMLYQDLTDSWSYTTTSWRQMRGQSGAVLEFVSQLNYTHEFILSMSSSTTGNQPSIGIGTTSSAPATEATGAYGANSAAKFTDFSYHKRVAAQGYYGAYPLELGASSATFYGDNGGTNVLSGFQGWVWS